MAYPKGCQWAEKIGAGRGVAGEKGAHLDRAEAAEGDQRLRACTGASVISGTAISADRQALPCLSVVVRRSGGRRRQLGGRRWTGRWRAQIGGRLGLMTCPPARTDSDGVKAICMARAARQAGRSVRAARAAVRCAPDAPNCVRHARDRARRSPRRARAKPYLR